MKNLLAILVVSLLAMFGCSGGGKAPIAPDINTSSQGSMPVSDEGVQILQSGTMDIETGLVEPNERVLDPYYDITSILGTNFSFTINGIIPPDIVDITLRINNFSSLTAYDVLIVFENLYGKKVTNPDSYIDIYKPFDLDPFIAFRKESPTRAFPPGLDTEKLLLKYPPGSSTKVDYFIIAHLPGNTGGVYEIRDWTVHGTLTPGGYVDVDVTVLDYQHNQSMVAAETSVFTGGITYFTPGTTQDVYTARITNSQNAGPGTYPVIVMGTSPASPAYNTFNIFELTVISGGDLICDIQTIPDPPDVTQGVPITFDGSGSTGGFPITTYEWDFDYDGVIFDTETEGAVVNWYVCEPGSHYVALRITDSDMNSEICSVTVNIAPDTGPTSGWSTDELIVDSLHGPFILNISHRAIRAYKNDLYVVMNSTSDAAENIYFIRSGDLGDTWGDLVQVTNYASGAYTEYANLWVDGNTDDIYIRYDHDDLTTYFNVYCVKSTDRGDTWGTPVKVNPGVPGDYTNQYEGAIVIDDSVNPSRLYVSYYDESYAGDYDIFVATTTTDNFNSWNAVLVDDSSVGALQPSIYVNPVDHSINVAWCDALYYNGTGSVMFDRSTDNGQTWGTDRTAYAITGDVGPYEPCLAIQPTTGTPGILFRERNSSIGTCDHKFIKANNKEGTSWNAPVILTGDSSGDCWAGTLDVSDDGHWVAIFEEDPYDWWSMFTESFDDGASWSSAIAVDDVGWIWNTSMAFDDCGFVHVIWADYRTGDYEVYYDRGE